MTHIEDGSSDLVQEPQKISELDIPRQDQARPAVKEIIQEYLALQDAQRIFAAIASRSEIGLSSTLRTRCERTELLLRVILLLLRIEPNSPKQENPASYIKEKVENAISTFGLKVTELPQVSTLSEKESQV